MYRLLLRPILFLSDPEKVHHRTFRWLRFLFSVPGIPGLFRAMFRIRRETLQREVFGLKFPNPLGLAAGFDKDALLGDKWENLGFGFVELGTVTPRPQTGNPKPRLFRLPADQAVINRMGFNNGGVQEMAERLKKLNPNRNIIIGGNIGKNKDTPNDKAVDDYILCFDALHPYVDYFVVNVSSPNTPGLRELQEKEPLRKLLAALKERNRALAKPRPLLLKIAPDLTLTQLDDVIEIALDVHLAGLVATNTTLSREGLATPKEEVEAIGAGGLSGAPLTTRSTEIVKYIYEKTKGKLPIIAVGGIMTPEDAKAKLEAGASLVQVYTGFVYAGPGMVKGICKRLA